MPFERQRELRPAIFRDPGFLDLRVFPRTLLLHLGWYADDQGRERVNPSVMKGQMFPTDDDVTPETIIDALLLLAELGHVEVYSDGRQDWYQIVPWALWWRVDRPGASVLPEAPETPSRSIAMDREASRSFAVVEGESEGGREGESGSEGGRGPLAIVRDSGGLAEPFCASHLQEGYGGPCRACGRQRLVHQREIRMRSTP